MGLRLAVVLDRWRAGAGGLEAWAADVLPRLARRHEVWLVARDASRFAPPGCRPRPAAAPLPWPRPLRDLADARAQEVAVRALAADRVLVLRSVPVAGATCYAHGGSGPHLQAARGEGRGRLAARVQAALEARTVAVAGALLAPSPKVARELRERRPDLACPVLPPPLPAGVPEPVPATAPPRLLFCGRDARLKGARAALACFRLLRRDWPGATLDLWARSPEHLERVLGAGRAALAREGVSLHGWDGGFRSALRGAALVLHPTRYDACSLVCLEALAAGVPVLTTPAAGLTGLVRDPWLGVVEDVATAAGAAAALVEARLAAGVGPARELAGRIRRDHGVEAHAARLGDLLEEELP